MIKLRKNFAALALAAVLAILGTACATDDAEPEEVESPVESPLESPMEEAS